jgi:hypothetical protein
MCDAAAVVLDAHQHARALAQRGDRHAAGAVHGLDGVHHQVEQHLAQLLGNAGDPRHVREARLDGDAVA